MTFINTLFDPEKLFMKTVNKFENSMELLWDCCENNVLPKDIPDFDKNLDPLDGRKMAREDIEKRILSQPKRTKVGEVVKFAADKINKNEHEEDAVVTNEEVSAESDNVDHEEKDAS